MFPASDQLPLGIIMLLMSVLALWGLKRVYTKQPPSDEMPIAI
ncbi:multidrug resistance protein D [Vibrio cholerae]|nr:multidrug resistance D domain protein [Vibrio cholerae HC-42A1]EKG65719.1 multidrug resistance D domain protein [Vibrio cholerae HC-52A1]EKG69565.1 multidrug resistance D domain protein [Vibrio cholerae CP1037(10)]CSB05154.1 multidrug resistance protein D [Vibrio cholerae]CSB07806.1 multidrug resistance protein D [Vibrio cholerae]